MTDPPQTMRAAALRRLARQLQEMADRLEGLEWTPVRQASRLPRGFLPRAVDVSKLEAREITDGLYS